MILKREDVAVKKPYFSRKKWLDYMIQHRLLGRKEALNFIYPQHIDGKEVTPIKTDDGELTGEYTCEYLSGRSVKHITEYWIEWR